MVFSIHIADVGVRDALWIVAAQRRLQDVPGIHFGVTMNAVALRASSRPPLPDPCRVGVIAAWRDEEAYDRFLTEDPLAARLASGWRARLRPLRVWGAWPAAGRIPTTPDADDGAPVAGLTLGRMRLRRVLPFLAASARAERAALEHPGMLAGTAFTRPPHTVATFSLWRDAEAVRRYAVGDSPEGHRHAMEAHRRRSFHHEAVFIRMRPEDVHGRWAGRDPLA